MNQSALQTIGGIGLFLVGMFVMTDGLKALAGRSLRTALQRFTRSPASGAAAGAVTTAVIQSSSATTVAAVGFVGAGLMTFGQALGIIFGANLGTTLTGWLVAIFGFKVPLGTLAYPIVFVGALARVFTRGRVAAAGVAIAGFGLVFVGIDLLQAGMSGLEGQLTPDVFPPNTLFGRLQLVGIGSLITVVTQSSSAGVALALASVHAGTISFPQAAAMVIGMDIGTTATAAMATIGGGTQVRRTGLAHVIYNLLTGLAAFVLLVPYVEVVERLGPDLLADQPELLLVGFHTFFNGLGVLAVLPLAGRFARLIERLIPVPKNDPTHALDHKLLSDSDASLDVVNRTIRDLAGRTLAAFLTAWRTRGTSRTLAAEVDQLQNAVSLTREFTLRIESAADDEDVRLRREAAVHVADHLQRLLRRIALTERLETVLDDPELSAHAEPMLEVTSDLSVWLTHGRGRCSQAASVVAADLVDAVGPYRDELIVRSVRRRTDGADLSDSLDAMRWLARVAVHVERIAFHVSELAEPSRGVSQVDEEPEL